MALLMARESCVVRCRAPDTPPPVRTNREARESVLPAYRDGIVARNRPAVILLTIRDYC
jgi:hypothetical protein